MTGGIALVITDLVVGGVLIAASAWCLTSASGVLLGLSGAAWLLGDLLPAATFLHRGLLIHLVLCYPTGRPRRAAVGVAVVVGYLSSAVYPLAANDVVSLNVCLLVMLAALYRHQVETGPDRRAAAVALAASVTLSAALALGPAARFGGAMADTIVLAMYDLLVAAVAIGVWADLVWGGSTRGALTGLVIDLGDAASPDVLRDHLARALGDPSLVLGYWLAAQGRYVKESGCGLELPPPGGPRVVTPLVQDGQPLAVLIHDSAVPSDRGLLVDVAAAARWAMANVRLRAEVQARIDSVEASRRGILTAADDERRRLEEKLQRGAERRLARVAELVGADGSGLGQLVQAVGWARTDLRELARGLHPRSLTEGGLPAGLHELARRFPMPVQLDVPPGRLPEAIETAAYFVCAEALTNVVKYARAAHVQVRVTRHEAHLSVVVADDGAGGADMGLGTGLRGLADRAEALGGRLELQSPVGGGTRLSVSVPISWTVSPGSWMSTWLG